MRSTGRSSSASIRATGTTRPSPETKRERASSNSCPFLREGNNKGTADNAEDADEPWLICVFCVICGPFCCLARAGRSLTYQDFLARKNDRSLHPVELHQGGSRSEEHTSELQSRFGI